MFLAAHRASELELVGSYLVSVGYLKEAVDLVDHHSVRLRQLVRAAHERGYPMSERWDERMTLFFSRSKASLFERVIEPLRVQVGFHLKQSVFEDWLDSAEGEVRLSQTNGLTKEGRFYPASLHAVAAAVSAAAQNMTEIRDAQLALIEAHTCGDARVPA